MGQRRWLSARRRLFPASFQPIPHAQRLGLSAIDYPRPRRPLKSICHLLTDQPSPSPKRDVSSSEPCRHLHEYVTVAQRQVQVSNEPLHRSLRRCPSQRRSGHSAHSDPIGSLTPRRSTLEGRGLAEGSLGDMTQAWWESCHARCAMLCVVFDGEHATRYRDPTDAN